MLRKQSLQCGPSESRFNKLATTKIADENDDSAASVSEVLEQFQLLLVEGPGGFPVRFRVVVEVARVALVGHFGHNRGLKNYQKKIVKQPIIRELKRLPSIVSVVRRASRSL